MDMAFASSSEAGVTSNIASYVQGQHNSNDMEVDSDAQSAASVQIITESASDVDAVRVKAIYHQGTVTQDDPSSYSWRLPAPPLAYKPKNLKSSKEHPIVIAYARSCGLIKKNWKTTAENCIPADLQARTPYSLVLLNALRRLSSATKEDLPRAQSLLIDACNQRMLGSNITSYSMVRLIETSNTGAQGKSFGPHCEKRIIENVFGLTIEDINRAISSLNQIRAEESRTDQTQLKTPARIGRQQKRLARRDRRNQALQLSTVDRVLKRRKTRGAAKSAANRAFSLGDELVDIELHQDNQAPAFAVPPNSPIATFDRLATLSRDVALREVGSRHNEQAGSMDQAEEFFSIPSKSDREHEKQMSRVLDNMYMSSSKSMRNSGRRLRRLQAGGFSRRHNGAVSMPSEKFNLDSLPSLHSMSSKAAPDELVRMGQLPLPDLSKLELESATHERST